MTSITQTLNVRDLLGSLRRKNVPIPYEVGTYLALETCEQIQERPSEVDINDIWVDAQGSITVNVAHSIEGSPSRATESILSMLSELLLAAAPGVPDPLIALVEPDVSSLPNNLTELRDDLLSKLVPLNRQASRRVLGRLFREATREGDAHYEEFPGTDRREKLDTDVDALLDSFPPAAGTHLPQGIATSVSLFEAMASEESSAFSKESTLLLAAEDTAELGSMRRARTLWASHTVWFWVFAAIGTAAVAIGTIVLLR